MTLESVFFLDIQCLLIDRDFCRILGFNIVFISSAGYHPSTQHTQYRSQLHHHNFKFYLKELDFSVWVSGSMSEKDRINRRLYKSEMFSEVEHFL